MHGSQGLYIIDWRMHFCKLWAERPEIYFLCSYIVNVVKHWEHVLLFHWLVSEVFRGGKDWMSRVFSLHMGPLWIHMNPFWTNSRSASLQQHYSWLDPIISAFIYFSPSVYLPLSLTGSQPLTRALINMQHAVTTTILSFSANFFIDGVQENVTTVTICRGAAQMQNTCQRLFSLPHLT